MDGEALVHDLAVVGVGADDDPVADAGDVVDREEEGEAGALAEGVSGQGAGLQGGGLLLDRPGTQGLLSLAFGEQRSSPLDG